LYLNWCDQKNGKDDTDVWIKKSTDGGETWSDRILVNQDESDGKSANHQFFTWMDIDPSTGYLYFVYYDRRNYDDNRTDVFISASRDGGKTFVDTRVSEAPFIPNENIFFGDYLNIAAVNGMIRPIWPTYSEKEGVKLWVGLVDEAVLEK
jgi:hypothetical protein